MRAWILLSVLLWTPAPVWAQRQAPNRMAVVVDVIRAHPEIDACDENQRGAIVDYAAQRLNAGAKKPWGRKSRGKPSGDVAVNPNTDGLTFLRADGKFEIYDVLSGAPPCGATWDGGDPFNPGENGYWAPPQLGPESGPVVTPPPPPPPAGITRAELDAAIAKLHADLWGEIANTLNPLRARVEALEAKPVDLSGLSAAIDAALVNYEVNGKSRSSFGHQHLVQLGLSKKQ